MSKKPQQQNQEYQIKPKPREKFKSSKCRDLIQEILQQKLKSVSYQDVTPASKDIAENIKNRLKYNTLYKVDINSQYIGQGVRVGTKCFWDYDTDKCVSETFKNDSLFYSITFYSTNLKWIHFLNLLKVAKVQVLSPLVDLVLSAYFSFRLYPNNDVGDLWSAEIRLLNIYLTFEYYQSLTRSTRY